MGFTEKPRPPRDLGQVIRDSGGIENFNRLYNPPVAGGPEQPRGRRKRPRARPLPPSRPLPERWRAHPEPEDY